MLLSSLCAPLAGLIAYTVTVSAAPSVPTGPSLTVETSTSNVNVYGLDNLMITVTVVNTGEVALKLLNDPRGVLNPFPENTFTITDSSGSHPSFNGATVNHNPAETAGLGDPNVFTVLAPGDSIDVNHDLSAAYTDFTQSGAGDYSVEPSSFFTYVDGDGTPKDLHATVEGLARVKFSGDPAVSRRTHDKRDTIFTNCSPRQKEEIIVAAGHAQTLATEAYDYLRRISSKTNVTPRYKRYFGAYKTSHKLSVQGVFGRMKEGDKFLKDREYDCACHASARPTWAAYVDGDDPREIWLCKPFWEVDIITQASILVHELSHFPKIGNTKDTRYGEAAAIALARKYPGFAISNGPSYQYFVNDLVMGGITDVRH